ncbi:condensation domain-containing protein [Kribbella soli]|uniref:Condensation domain-containing protein n=1 Tax=Kribbella soli TaxID=1124743 RepID=A0A4R0HB05_9ACTN|nr:condensation domain-containing protein [Kribbella soli]TCC06300.1 hypothetical protein E0H45_30715 [Kribbella soli]
MTQLTEELAALPPSRRAALLARLRAGGSGHDTDIPRTDASQVEAPLTAAQRSLWFVEQLNPGTPTYNLPQYLRLRGPLDVEALRRALVRVVERHEALRSLLLERDSGPVQLVLPQILVELPVHDAAGRSTSDVLSEADRVYGRTVLPLDRAPLWRAALYRLAPDEHLFVFVVHHAIFDGLSFGVFDRDLAAFYAEECGRGPANLPSLPVRYSDYARWHVGRLSDERLRVLQDFWRTELGGAETAELPTDRPRPAKPTAAGAVAVGRIPADVCAAVRELSRQRRTTVFVVCLAAFWVLLHRRTGGQDVIVGSSTAGRNHAAVANSIGYFVNVVALRGRFADRPTFAELVDQATRCITETLAHGDLGFEEVVRVVAPDRDSGRSPLFQVSFAVGGDQAGPPLAGLQVEPLQMHHGTARFDMAWGVTFGEHADVGVEYSTELFDLEHVEGLIEEYAEILRAFARSPEVPVSSPHPEDSSIDQSVREACRRHPDAVAIRCRDGELTYEGLLDCLEAGSAADGWPTIVRQCLGSAGDVGEVIAEALSLRPGDELAVDLLDHAEPGPERLAAVRLALLAGATVRLLDGAERGSAAPVFLIRRAAAGPTETWTIPARPVTVREVAAYDTCVE